MNLLLLAAALVSPQQFDLHCVGAGGVSPPTQIDWRPLDVVLRIDLATKRWCEGDCLVIHNIEEVQPGRIVLEKQSDYEKAMDIVRMISIDRVTGEYMRIEENRTGPIDQKGECQVMPFAGFPKPETKF